MTPTQTQTVLDMIVRVDPTTGNTTGFFPQAKFSPQEYQLLGERISSIDITVEQAKAAIGQLRANASGPYSNRPEIRKIVDTLREVEAQSRPRPATTGTSGRGLVAYYRVRDGYGTEMSDEAVALAVADEMARGWRMVTVPNGRKRPYTADEIREHLVLLYRELHYNLVQAWSLAFKAYPDAERQKQVREELVRQGRWRESRTNRAGVEAMFGSTSRTN